MDEELPSTPSLNFNDVRPRDTSSTPSLKFSNVIPRDTSKLSAVSRSELKKKSNAKNGTRYQTASKLNGKGSKLNSNKKFKPNINSNRTESDKLNQTFSETDDINNTLSNLPNVYVPGIENTMDTLPINSEDIVKEEYPLVSSDTCQFDLKVIPVRNLDSETKPPFWVEGLPHCTQDSLEETYPKREEELLLWGRKLPAKPQNTPNSKNPEGQDKMLGTESYPDKVVDSHDILSRVVAESLSNFGSFPDK